MSDRRGPRRGVERAGRHGRARLTRYFASSLPWSPLRLAASCSLLGAVALALAESQARLRRLGRQAYEPHGVTWRRPPVPGSSCRLGARTRRPRGLPMRHSVSGAEEFRTSRHGRRWSRPARWGCSATWSRCRCRAASSCSLSTVGTPGCCFVERYAARKIAARGSGVRRQTASTVLRSAVGATLPVSPRSPACSSGERLCRATRWSAPACLIRRDPAAEALDFVAGRRARSGARLGEVERPGRRGHGRCVARGG